MTQDTRSNVVLLNRRRTDQDIDQLSSLYQEAELAIKATDIKHSEHSLPPINELRYAGFHIIKGLEYERDGANEDCRVEFNKAERHCLRAIYDAHEITLMFSMNVVRSYIDKYDYEVFQKCIPEDNSKIRKRLRETADNLEKYLANKDIDNDRDTRRRCADWCKNESDYYKEIIELLESHEAGFSEFQQKVLWGKCKNIIVCAGALGTIIIATLAIIKHFQL